MVHHARLGSADNPDIIRYEQFDLEAMTGCPAASWSRVSPPAPGLQLLLVHHHRHQPRHPPAVRRGSPSWRA